MSANANFMKGICTPETIESYEKSVNEYITLEQLHKKSIINEQHEHRKNQTKIYEAFSSTLSLEFYNNFLMWFITGTIVISVLNLVVLCGVLHFKSISKDGLKIKNEDAHIHKVFPTSITETNSTGTVDNKSNEIITTKSAICVSKNPKNEDNNISKLSNDRIYNESRLQLVTNTNNDTVGENTSMKKKGN